MRATLPTVDDELLAAARRGERAAHARLYELLAPPLYTLARRMLGSKAPAEDMLQETFLEVIRRIGSYRGEAPFGFWVKRIAINKCLLHLRSSWTTLHRDDGELDALPSTALRAPDDEIALERALDALPAVSRAVVWLHDVEGYTHREIGRLLGRTASFSKSQLARTHERLRAVLAAEPDRQPVRADERAATAPNSMSEPTICTPVLKTC